MATLPARTPADDAALIDFCDYYAMIGRDPLSAYGYLPDPQEALRRFPERGASSHGCACNFWSADIREEGFLGGFNPLAVRADPKLRSVMYFARTKVKRDGEMVEEEIDAFVCGFFTVFGHGHDPIAKRDVLLLRCLRADGSVVAVSLPRDVIAKGGPELAAYCEARGFRVSTDKKPRDVLQKLLSALHGPRVAVATRTGWHGDTLAFVMPDGSVIGDSGGVRVHFEAERSSQVFVAKGGTFDAWKDAIDATVPGNSRLALSLAAAFASPLLQFAPVVNSSLFNFFGESSRGKSTVSFLYGSVWGGSPKRKLRFAHSWNTTDNSMAQLCAAHSGFGLVLDELQMCAAPGRMAYVVSSGEEKNRLTAEIKMRLAQSWSLIALSTGEKNLDEAILEIERRDQTSSGTGVRCIDVPAIVGEHGVYDDLRGFASGEALSDAVGAIADTHYGHAGPAFVEALARHIASVEPDGRAQFRQATHGAVGEFVKSLELPAGTDPTVFRAARVFALVAVAGGLACEFGVLPMKREVIEDGVRQCFRDWAEARGPLDKSAAQRKVVLELRNHLQRSARNIVNVMALARKDLGTVSADALDAAESAAGTVDGYLSMFHKRPHYLLFASVITAVERKAKRGGLLDQLRDLGLLTETVAGRKDVVTRVAGKPVRVLAVDARILTLGDDFRFGHAPEDGVPLGSGSVVKLDEAAIEAAEAAVRWRAEKGNWQSGVEGDPTSASRARKSQKKSRKSSKVPRAKPDGKGTTAH